MAVYLVDEARSVVVGNGDIHLYDDLLANVRYDSQYHSVKALVQPDDPTVREIAGVLMQADDFISAAQKFVDSFTTYQREEGDYWTTPAELLEAEAGDCDDKAILLCSILRNGLPADKIYCAFGEWIIGGKPGGHMWLVTEGEDGEDVIIEATNPPEKITKGNYVLHGMFNDKYAFATSTGLREFDMKAVELETVFAGG